MESLWKYIEFWEEIKSKLLVFISELITKVNELLDNNSFSNEEKLLLLEQAKILYWEMKKSSSNIRILPFHNYLIKYGIENNLFIDS